jgi:hypothetical protein
MPRSAQRRLSSEVVAESPASEGSVPSFLGRASLFNTTFSLYRVSPLFLGPTPLTPTRLEELCGNLRELLVGDVVRGVQVGDGTTDATMSGAGSLEAVTLQWLPPDGFLDSTSKVLHLELHFETAVHTALLLPRLNDDRATNDSFIDLPLLLMRMPAPLKTVVAGFLSTTFDCRVSPLRLRSDDLLRIWEQWATDSGLPHTGPLAKDVVLTLEIRLTTQASSNHVSDISGEATSGIKSIDIIVPNAHLTRLLQAGKEFRSTETVDNHLPFTAALAQYLKQHLAFDVTRPGVGVARIACGGFVLSDGRLKLFSPANDHPGDTRANQAPIMALLRDIIAQAGR